VHVQPLNQDSAIARSSHRGSASSDGSTHERRLYRQGSIGTQIGGSVIELRLRGSEGNFSTKSYASSSKSVRSRTATRAEYHEDLKPQLEQVYFPCLSVMQLIVCLLHYLQCQNHP